MLAPMHDEAMMAEFGRFPRRTTIRTNPNSPIQRRPLMAPDKAPLSLGDRNGMHVLGDNGFDCNPCGYGNLIMRFQRETVAFNEFCQKWSCAGFDIAHPCVVAFCNGFVLPLSAYHSQLCGEYRSRPYL